MIERVRLLAVTFTARRVRVGRVYRYVTRPVVVYETPADHIQAAGGLSVEHRAEAIAMEQQARVWRAARAAVVERMDAGDTEPVLLAVRTVERVGEGEVFVPGARE